MMRLHVALVGVAQDDDSEEADAASQIPAEFQGGVDTIEILCLIDVCGQLPQTFLPKNSMYIDIAERTIDFRAESRIDLGSIK